MERLTSAPARQEDSAHGITLRLLLSGDAIVGLMSASNATQFDYEHFATDAERGAGRDLAEQISDWGQILSDLGPGERIDAGASLSEDLIAAMEAGLLPYGTTVTKPFRTGNMTVMLNVATFFLRRAASLKEELAATAPA